MLNIKFINSQDAYNFRAGKILEKVLLTGNKIINPRFYFTLKIPSYKTIVENLGVPFVAKQSRSNFGKKVFLIRNEKDFTSHKDKFIQNLDNQGLWFFEEFIDHTQTIRGIVTGNKCKVKIVVEKEENSFKTNHGKATFSNEIDPQFEKICVKAAKLLMLELAGVDTVYNMKTKKINVLEINKSPGITLKPKHSIEVDQIADYISTAIKLKNS